MQLHHKWSYQSRAGVYLVTLPIHSTNLVLVLSLNTGLVSPQFYVKFDTQSQTVEQEELSSQWQLKAGLVTLIGGIPLSADPTPMQRSGGRKTHLERRIKKLKHYESRHKDPEPGMKKWGKK